MLPPKTLSDADRYIVSRYGWDALEVKCGQCNGEGVFRNEDNDLIDCPNCGGTGVLR